jgi:hypothetical protein
MLQTMVEREAGLKREMKLNGLRGREGGSKPQRRQKITFGYGWSPETSSM